VLVYLDTNIVVYLTETVPPYTAAAEAAIDELLDERHLLVVSHLVRMECKVGALTSGDPELILKYGLFFTEGVHSMLGLPPKTFDLAAEIRATYRIGAVDALHLATAIVGGCDAFLTNDIRLSAFPDITMMMLTPN